MTTAVADRTLTAADRCDRCGAQAYVRVVLGPPAVSFFSATTPRRRTDPQAAEFRLA